MKYKNKYTLGLAGNPNVGKSTVFNALTGMKQHTGNWTGKTVSCAYGEFTYEGGLYTLVDLPGTYSLDTDSAEEKIAKDFIIEDSYDAVIVVCDATCLERNLILALQVLQITPNVILCLNLIDEASKKHIKIDIAGLSEILQIPVVPCAARSKKGLGRLCEQIKNICEKGGNTDFKVRYPNTIENALKEIIPLLPEKSYKSRYDALTIIKEKNSVVSPEIGGIVENLYSALPNSPDKIIKSSLILTAEGICNEVLSLEENYNKTDRIIDKYITGKYTGFPLMMLLLFFIMWLTISGANYPSRLLSNFLFYIQDKLTEIFLMYNIPQWLHGVLVLGVYRTMAWIVAVMLPPMAIFFPLFTLLEDFGYLPRVAFNLDRNFEKAGACGKQSLTMCMGLGCNAVGVTGCRIINSPRERLIAILTNSFMPCNGRFPTMIAIITMFFGGMALNKNYQNLLSAVILTGVIIFAVILTLLISKILSKTLLRGMPSSFTLEMPSYRTPQFGKVLIRSIFDRTLFVLGRAVAVAAPAGLIIWLMANVFVGGESLLTICSDFLNPFAELFGMDGVIILAFILGFPANEIVVPIMIMAYTATGSLVDYESLDALKTLFLENGWTVTTAVSVLIFSLCHWPCSTTCLTIKKETGSLKWTFLSFILPTAMGLLLCFIFNMCVKFII